MKHTAWVPIMLSICVAISTASGALAQAQPVDYPIPGGHFYSQANGQGGGPGEPGYTITNDGGITFYNTFATQGGVSAFGYPASQRLPYGGFVDQILQKSVFQWNAGAVAFLNVMDVLHDAGKDAWLQTNYQTPAPEDTSPDTGLTFAQVEARHLAFLDSNSAIQTAYNAVSDPIALYGLPMTHPISELNGAAIVVRCQRAVLQQWTVAEPWAAAGQVTVANGGDIFKASGLVPSAELLPIPAPTIAPPPVSVTPVMLTTADLPVGFIVNPSATRPILNGQLNVFVQGNPLNYYRGPVAIANSAQAFASVSEADSELAAKAASDPGTLIPALANASFQKITPPSIGQATVAYTITGTRNGVAGTGYLIAYVEKDYVISVVTFGVPGTVSLSEATGLAQVVDNRILAHP